MGLRLPLPLPLPQTARTAATTSLPREAVYAQKTSKKLSHAVSLNYNATVYSWMRMYLQSQYRHIQVEMAPSATHPTRTRPNRLARMNRVTPRGYGERGTASPRSFPLALSHDSLLWRQASLHNPTCPAGPPSIYNPHPGNSSCHGTYPSPEDGP